MLLQRSKLAAAPLERPRLAPPWLIALLGMMALVVLVAIYPHKTLVDRIQTAPSGPLTEAYLRNLLRVEPNNPELRIVLARNQYRAGLYERIGDTLVPSLLANDPQIRNEAEWILWLSDEAQYRKLAKNSAERAKAQRRLQLQLEKIAELDWNEPILIEIAHRAVSFGDVALGRKLLERLSASGRNRGDYWYAYAAREALANSEYSAAAEFYLIALTSVSGFDERRQYFLNAMRALQSGDRIDEALRVAELQLSAHPELARDDQILELLVRFARAARRPDLADKYARLLLRLSLLKQWKRQHLAENGFDAHPERIAFNDSRKPSAGPQLPFDDRIYLLGFEAFLDNKKLNDAWKVAASAVRHSPDNLEWRERLAKVSEWSGRPQVGLDNWLFIARQTGRDDAWQAVLRLAPGLFDENALRLALTHQLSQTPDDEKLQHELVALYERDGNPQAGQRFLEQLYQRTRKAQILAQLAELAERMGERRQALDYWQRYLAQGTLIPPVAVRVAVLYLLDGRPDEALMLLKQAEADAEATDVGFWRLTGEIARFVQKDDDAIGAYRRVVGSDQAEAKDYDALRLLLQNDYPLEAAEVAAASWQRFHQPADLVHALRHYAARERWTDMGRLLAGLDVRQRTELQLNAEFLQYSAQYRLNIGDVTMARSELEAAQRIAPDSADIQQALLWLLIDSGDGEGLRAALTRAEPAWRPNPAMHDVLGAAYLALSLPDVALRRYYTPHLADRRDDFLWLMNFADALEQNQASERAWRLREYLLTRERPVGERKNWLADVPVGQLGSLRRTARARLAIARQRGDDGLAVLRELLRLDRDANQSLSPAAKDVALGWMQEGMQYAAERGWLWQQYAKTAARPLWAEISLALAENDHETAGRLLERHGVRLPRYDRINAANLVGERRRAQSDAFDTQTLQPDDNELHLQLTEGLLAFSDRASTELASRRVGTIDERERKIAWHTNISQSLALDVSLASIARSNRDTNVIGRAPDETFRNVSLAWKHRDGETRLTAGARKSFDNYQPLLVEHEQRIDERLSFTAALGREQTATESAALRVAGMKNLGQLGLRYRLTQRDEIGIERRWEKFSTQTGTKVGTGRIWQIEASHALRLATPDLLASAFWTDNRYSRQDNISDTRLTALAPPGQSISDVGPDFFLPENFRYYGLRLSTDARYEREYTRAWRPYASIAKTWHSSLGPGYDLAAGVAGSVFGGDHLRLGWSLGKGGKSDGGLVREIGLYYFIHF